MDNLDEVLKRYKQARAANGSARHDDNGSDVAFFYEETPEDLCDICQGRLWLVFDVPVGHPDFGRTRPCECIADVVNADRTDRLRRYSNLGPLSRMTFESADPWGRADDPESGRLFGAAYKAAQAYADNPTGWLALTGPNGSGKTHLAAAIANHCIEHGRPVFFVHVPDLLDDLRSTYSPTSAMSYSELFEQVNEAPLLILDGLGTQSPTPWAQEKLQQIFNRRANAELPTVVTTAADIAEIDPYISSRMLNRDLCAVLEVRGRSHEPRLRLGRVPSEMIERMTFDTFDTRGNAASAQQRRSLEVALATSNAWASDPSGWLTLFGETGCGKTHLAVSIAATRLARGLPVFFAFVPELMDYLRFTFQPNSGAAYDRVFDEVRNAPMLILDDLGGEYRSEWVYEKLYQIIVHRHNLRLPTIITTGMNVPDTAGPIVSRIQDPASGLLIRMEAPDYRIKRRDGNRQGTPERDARRRGAR